MREFPQPARAGKRGVGGTCAPRRLVGALAPSALGRWGNGPYPHFTGTHTVIGASPRLFQAK